MMITIEKYLQKKTFILMGHTRHHNHSYVVLPDDTN